MKALLIAATLLATIPLLSTASAVETPEDTCVNYLYVADYQWYYVCAGLWGDCHLYTKHVVGTWEERTCLA